MDTAGHGQGRRARVLDGAGHLEGAWACAASLIAVSSVVRSGLAEKLQDVVGLYVAPPAHAVVLSVDEKVRSRRSTAPRRLANAATNRSRRQIAERVAIGTVCKIIGAFQHGLLTGSRYIPTRRCQSRRRPNSWV